MRWRFSLFYVFYYYFISKYDKDRIETTLSTLYYILYTLYSIFQYPTLTPNLGIELDKGLVFWTMVLGIGLVPIFRRIL